MLSIAFAIIGILAAISAHAHLTKWLGPYGFSTCFLVCGLIIVKALVERQNTDSVQRKRQVRSIVITGGIFATLSALILLSPGVREYGADSLDAVIDMVEDGSLY